MSSSTAIGGLGGSAATAQIIEAAVDTIDTKKEAAAFQKHLIRTALTLQSNSLLDAYDTMSELEDGEDE